MIEFIDATGRIVRCVSKQATGELNGDEILLRLLRYAPEHEFMSRPCITHNTMSDAEKREVKGNAGAGKSGGKIPKREGA